MTEVTKFLQSFVDNELYKHGFVQHKWESPIIQYCIDSKFIICMRQENEFCYFSMTREGYDQLSFTKEVS